MQVYNKNKAKTSDRRTRSKGINCTSMDSKELKPYWKDLEGEETEDKDDRKKTFCKTLLHKVCNRQLKNDMFKIAYTPFESIMNK